MVGNVHYPSNSNARLLDFLNGLTNGGSIKDGGFIELIDATIQYTDGWEEKLKFSYTNNSIIQLAVSLGDADSGRGIGAHVGLKSYPFVEKSQLSVRVVTHDYSIKGNIYHMSYQMIKHVLEDKTTFLPLTHVQVCNLANDALEDFPFAAVNKEQIVSLQDAEFVTKKKTKVTRAESYAGSRV